MGDSDREKEDYFGHREEDESLLSDNFEAMIELILNGSLKLKKWQRHIFIMQKAVSCFN